MGRSKPQPQKPHRSKGRRVTVEQQQEGRSRAQFEDRLTEFGWIVNPIVRDHGEDFVIAIYDAGNSTGLSFFAQLKSAEDAARLVPKKQNDTISYRLEVHDLEHWEVAAQLVVVFIWDMAKKVGVWMAVPDVIKQLGAVRKWRTQRRVTVNFPQANGTDDGSLHRLRRAVADHNLPIVRRGKTSKISAEFSFPKTPEGREAVKALQDALDYGETAKIAGSYVKKWKVAEWWERLYGPIKPLEVTISSSSSPLVEVPARLEVDTSSGTHTALLDLRRVKGGRQGFTLDNSHQGQPLRLELVAEREGQGARLNLHLGVTHPVPDIFQTRDATDLLLALREGVRMRLVQRETGKLIFESAVPQNFATRSVESLREWKAFMEKLCFVQARIYKFGTIVITNGRVSNRDARLVEDFYTICRTGFIERHMRFWAEIGLGKDPWPQLIARVRAGEKIEIRSDHPSAGAMKILNVNVPLGPVRSRQDVSDFIGQIEQALNDGESSVKVRVADVMVREEYPNWMPPSSTVP
jgi:hypothetical protein